MKANEPQPNSILADNAPTKPEQTPVQSATLQPFTNQDDTVDDIAEPNNYLDDIDRFYLESDTTGAD